MCRISGLGLPSWRRVSLPGGVAVEVAVGALTAPGRTDRAETEHAACQSPLRWSVVTHKYTHMHTHLNSRWPDPETRASRGRPGVDGTHPRRVAAACPPSAVSSGEPVCAAALPISHARRHMRSPAGVCATQSQRYLAFMVSAVRPAQSIIRHTWTWQYQRQWQVAYDNDTTTTTIHNQT